MRKFLRDLAPALFLILAAIALMLLALDAWEKECRRREASTANHLGQWAEDVRPARER